MLMHRCMSHWNSERIQMLCFSVKSEWCHFINSNLYFHFPRPYPVLQPCACGPWLCRFISKFWKLTALFKFSQDPLGNCDSSRLFWSVISIIWEMKQMKQNYRKLVLLICPDQGTGFVIVEAVIMAETESSHHNLAFVKARPQDAGTSHTPFRQTGLAVTASHTHTLAPTHMHSDTSQSSEEKTVKYW